MNTTQNIPAAPLRRCLQALISESEKQRYGSEVDYRAGEIRAFESVLSIVEYCGSAPCADALEHVAGMQDDTPHGRGRASAYNYLGSLFRDYAAGDRTARVILADLGGSVTP